MKSVFFTVFFLILFNFQPVFSENGDTLQLVPIEFQGSREGWFVFPEATLHFEKIIMEYKLRCPPGKPCGEWDYDVNLFLRNYYAPNYSYKGRSLDTTFYMTSPGFTYTPVFEAGKIVSFDSTETPAQWIYLYDYQNEVSPTMLLDSIQVWDRYYTYKLEDGAIVDSVLTDYDEFITLDKRRVYFNDNVTIFDQFEIFRYITPYGNGITLGEGFSWIIDMTDFRPMLSGKAFFYAPATPSWIAPMSQNAYEDLELKFNFIEGIPERNIISLDFLWRKETLYNEFYENSYPEFEHFFPENVKNARFKLIHTGHGFGDDTENCAEFCEKTASLKVNGAEIWQQNVWRECGDNPVFPQGGTWLSDRSNWCPGAEVVPYDVELSEYITPGESSLLDFSMEYFKPIKVAQDPSNFPGRYKSTAYIVNYGELNFDYDIEILDVLSPTNKDMYRRFNPTCSNPEIIVRNRGSEEITKFDIYFSINGAEEHHFAWEGNLKYNEQDTVFLQNIAWDNNPDGNYFDVRIENPNENEDEYQSNNSAKTFFNQVPEFYQNMVLEFKTVNYDVYAAASPYRYVVYNSDGEPVLYRESTKNSTVYKDTMNLENGCYTMIFSNIYGYGLSYWPLTPLANGYLEFNKEGRKLINFHPDFGNTQYLQFVVKDHPEVMIEDNIDTLDLGTVDPQETVTKQIKIFAKNDEPVTITKADIKLGTIKGFVIKSQTPEINNNLEITKENGLELEIEYTGKLMGNQSSELIISSSNTFAPTTKIVLKAHTLDPSSVEIDNKVQTALDIIYDGNKPRIFTHLNYHSSNTEILISDILGNKVLSVFAGALSGENIFEISSDRLTPGVYFVTIKNEKDLQHKSFVLQK